VGTAGFTEVRWWFPDEAPVEDMVSLVLDFRPFARGSEVATGHSPIAKQPELSVL